MEGRPREVCCGDMGGNRTIAPDSGVLLSETHSVASGVGRFTVMASHSSRYWIQVGRPIHGTFSGARPVLVNGDCVGWIIPETGTRADAGTDQLTDADQLAPGRVHRQRSAGWGVYACRTLAIGAMPLGRALNASDGMSFVGRGPRFTDALALAREWDGWLVGVWSEMSGDHGYMPDSVGCVVGRASAVGCVVDRFSLGGRRARDLRRDLYIELNGARDGAQYASIQRCECSVCAEVTIADADTWECRLCD